MSKIIGIDLGTSNSAASVMEAGKPVIIPSAWFVKPWPPPHWLVPLLNCGLFCVAVVAAEAAPA
jgi:hypothetical protein